MAQNGVIVVLIVVLQVVLGSGQQLIEEGCPTATRPHMTRCDQYYRCTVLSKDAHVWVATQCQKGLVYMHNLATCVVPDSDWECDISSEKELNHSDENVYGIDNLHVPVASSAQAGSEEHSQELPISATSGVDRTKADGGSSSAFEQNDIESSGDGSLERLSDELSTAPTHIKAPTVDPSKSPLSATQLDSFLAYYDTQNALKLKGKLPPPKMTETSYLARLKQIVSQQKELNEMTKIPTNENIFSYKAIPVDQLAGGKQQQNATEAPPPSDLNLSPGMQEIIKSILDISQKAIANQKPPPAPAPAPEVKDPVVKPIFIPISLHPAPVAEVAPAAPVAIPTTTTATATTTTEQPAKATYSPTPPSIPSANELKFGQNSLRGPEVNNAIYHEYPQQVLYDAYGNKFIPKDAYQAVPPNYPLYNPYLSPVQPGAFYGQVPSLSRPGDGVSYFQDYRHSPLRINAPVNEFDADRVKPLDTIDSFESDDTSSLEKDLPLPLEKHEEDSDDEGFGEDSPSGSDTAHTKYKRKLFTLGDSTFDYEQYKDSMLPLINANPDDDRISVVLCMVGSRQPNSTDCFKYYICNPHNGMFQSYTCPPLTAFNKKSRMCDLTTYKHCAKVMNPPAAPRQQLRTRKQPVVKHPSTNQIREIKNELRKAQKYVEMIRLEASKLKHHSAPPQQDQKVIFLPSMGAPAQGATKRVPQEQAPAKKKKRKNSSAATKQSQPQRKVPRCRLEGRMPDPMDQSNYYVCHRKSPNKFIKMKMACPLNLSYCPDTQYCTLNGNC